MAKIINDEHEYSKANTSNTITAILVKPGQIPEIIEIPNTLEAKQDIVEGYIQAIYPFEDEVAIICNDEGKTNGMPLNRALYISGDMNVSGMEPGDIYDIIAGNFLVVGINRDNFCSLDDRLLTKYEKWYHNPEMFVFRDNKIIVLPGQPANDDKTFKAAYCNGFKYDLSDGDMLVKPKQSNDISMDAEIKDAREVSEEITTDTPKLPQIGKDI